SPALADPALGPGIGSIDTDIDDLRQFERPFSQYAEALVVPLGIGDQIDQDVDAERARKFNRLEIATETDPLAELLQYLRLSRLDADKHVLEADLLPKTKDSLVAQ